MLILKLITRCACYFGLCSSLMPWLSRSVEAGVIIDDFRSAPFVAQLGPSNAEPGEETLGVIQRELTGVLAETRISRVGNLSLQCCPGGEFTRLAVDTTDDGKWLFESDFVAESMSLLLGGFEVDATQADTSVLEISFGQYSSPEPRDITVFIFSELSSQLAIQIETPFPPDSVFRFPLSDLDPPEGVDLSRVNLLAIDQIGIEPGSRLTITSVRFVPEPSSLVLLLIAAPCLIRMSRPEFLRV